MYLLNDFQNSFGMFVVFDLEKPFPTTCKSYPETHVRVNKRKRSSSTSGGNEQRENKSAATICFRYNSMLHLGGVSEGELIVVEQPWLSVVANFPPALARRVYGT
jgi:U3 small nucleolar RNA-associated protein 4